MVRQLAELEGKSMDDVVRESIQARRDAHRMREDRKPGELTAKLMELARSTAPLWKEPHLSRTHGDLHYDEDGLPR